MFNKSNPFLVNTMRFTVVSVGNRTLAKASGDNFTNHVIGENTS